MTGATRLAIDQQDDATTTVDLPFAVDLYGQSFRRLSVCTNGWAASLTDPVASSVTVGVESPDGAADDQLGRDKAGTVRGGGHARVLDLRR